MAIGPLQNKIKQYKGQGGTLLETTGEELQTLAGKAGLQAQPTDPLSAQVIGANPHQAKMAASPQVQESALRLSGMPESEGLAATLRRNQARQEKTEAEEAEKAKVEQLKALGDTGKRVQSAIDSKVAQIAQSQVVPGVNAQALPTSVSDPVAFRQLLEKIQTNPKDNQTLLQLNQMLGRTVDSQLTPEEIQGYYVSANDAISKAASVGSPKAFTVNDVLANDPQALGMSVDQLGAILGVDGAVIRGYSIQQLGDAISALQQNEMSKAQQIDQQATSGDLGQAERGLARDLGREASATGIRSAEADMARLTDSVSRGDIVGFGGQQYTVEDLLGNDQISKTVSDYLNSPEGSPTRLQLSQTEPQLVKWIEEHKAALSEAARELTQGTQQFSDVQSVNNAIGTYGESQLNPAVLSALVPGYKQGQLSATTLDVNKVPALVYLSSLPVNKASAAVDTINSLLTPEQQAELAQFSPQEIAALELDKGPNSPVVKELLKSKVANQQLDSVSPSDPDAVYSLFMGVPSSAEELQSKLDDASAASLLFGRNYGKAGGLDMDRDGKLDDPTTILERMRKQTAAPTLHNAVEGNSGVFSTSDFQPADLETLSPVSQQLYDILGKYTGDGQLSDKEFKESGLLDNEDLLYQASKEPGLSGLLHDTVASRLSQFQDTRTKDLLGHYGTPDKDISDPVSKIGKDNVSGLQDLARFYRKKYQDLEKEAGGYREGRLNDSVVQDAVAKWKALEADADKAWMSAQDRAEKAAYSTGGITAGPLSKVEQKAVQSSTPVAKAAEKAYQESKGNYTVDTGVSTSQAASARGQEKISSTVAQSAQKIAKDKRLPHGSKFTVNGKPYIVGSKGEVFEDNSQDRSRK